MNHQKNISYTIKHHAACIAETSQRNSHTSLEYETTKICSSIYTCKLYPPVIHQLSDLQQVENCSNSKTNENNTIYVQHHSNMRLKLELMISFCKMATGSDLMMTSFGIYNK
jgi:hypothetical protein